MSQAQTNILIIVIAVTCLLALLIVFMALTIIIYNKRKRKMLLENEILKKTYQEEILKTQLEIQEQTLKTISEEIHDNIGQMLSLAKLNLALADAATGNPHPMQQKISDSFQLVKKSLQDLRHLSHSLNADYVSEMGLQRAIEYELEMIGKTGIISVGLHAEGTARRLDQQKELILFRIVQESLNNIIKHADATKIEIQIRYVTQEITLSISDNGKGMDTSKLTAIAGNNAGMGTRNMSSRAQLIGASFNINSSIGEGTTITLRLQDNTNHHEYKSH